MDMKTDPKQLIALGGERPLFNNKVPVGQLNLPEWEKVQSMFKGIFERQYYTNHGPLAAELENRLESQLGVRNAIVVTNATLGLSMTALALNIQGSVILPSFTFIATVQAMTLCGLEPIFCRINDQGLVTAETVKMAYEASKGKNIGAVLGVHLWGNSCHSTELELFCREKKLNLFYDAAQAFGCEVNGQPIAQFGKASVFSFHATKIVSAGEGGVICTNDDDLAERLRNIRSSYGIRKPVSVPFTGNGRMSEAQAGFALLSLDDYEKNRQRNKKYYDIYGHLLQNVPGVRVVECQGSSHNFQYLNLMIDREKFGVSRNKLMEILQMENINCRRYFYPPVHKVTPYKDMSIGKTALPTTEKLSECLIQLPSGYSVSEEDVECIAKTICLIHKQAHLFPEEIRS